MTKAANRHGRHDSILSKIVDRWYRLQSFVSKGPAYHYAYVRWRFVQVGRQLCRHYPVSPSSIYKFLAAFAPEHPSMAAVTKIAAENRAEEACRLLVTHFVTRQDPKFHFRPGLNALLVDALPSQVKQDTILAADDVCRNRFCFRGVPTVQFDGDVNWKLRPENNIDWTWELNRHFFFTTLGRAYQYTGDERYTVKFIELLKHWQATHPMDVRHNIWQPFEVAIRLNSWIWAFYLFLDSEVFQAQGLLDLLKGLLSHARFLAANLEYHIPNNHLLLEAKALAEVGLLFPEFVEATKWRRVGLKVLWHEIECQVERDGVHQERATLYQRLIASELLEMLLLLQRNGNDVPSTIMERFERMVEFQFAILRSDGSYPLFSDSSQQDAHIRFDACWGAAVWLHRPGLISQEIFPGEETIWLVGALDLLLEHPKRIESDTLKSLAFPRGGYVIMRHDRGDKQLHLTFDVGPFGYKQSPGHGHADALSFELFAYNNILVTDSGCYQNHAPLVWRNYFRSSRAHNTIVVDDQDQSRLINGWHVYRPAQATLEHWLATPDFDLADASHNGYQHLTEPVLHRRRFVFVKPAYWLLVDTLVGQGSHQFDLLFHLTPGTTWQLNGSTLYAQHGTGGNLCIALVNPNPESIQTFVIEGASEPIQGWVSLYSGQKRTAPVLCYRHTGQVPVHFISLLSPYPSVGLPPCKWARLDKMTEKATAFTVKWMGHQGETNTDYLLVKLTASPDVLQCGPYQSDAELLVVRTETDLQEPRAVLMDNGRELIIKGQSVISHSTPIRGHYLRWVN